MTERKPLSEEQRRVSAAALVAYPEGILADDEEMRELCNGLVDRGVLTAVGKGYMPSVELLATRERSADTAARRAGMN